MRTGVRLGVDVGTVRVGLAASDAAGLVATPVRTLARDARSGADLRAVAAEAREREAVEVVVGLPVSLSGAEGPSSRAVRGYAAELARRVAPVPVRLVDERLSTVSAHQALTASGRRGRRQREVVDQVAAVLILQTALDTERVSGWPPGSSVDPGPAPEPPAPV